MLDKYTLEVSGEALKTIAAALNELPHRMVRGLLDDLQAQVAKQEKAAVEAAEPAKDARPRLEVVSADAMPTDPLKKR